MYICVHSVSENKPVKYNVETDTLTPASISSDMALWGSHVLKLRIQTCGLAVIDFYGQGILRVTIVINGNGIHVATHAGSSIQSIDLEPSP